MELALTIAEPELSVTVPRMLPVDCAMRENGRLKSRPKAMANNNRRREFTSISKEGWAQKLNELIVCGDWCLSESYRLNSTCDNASKGHAAQIDIYVLPVELR